MTTPRPRPSPMLITGALLLALAATFVVMYWRIGSYVEADGTLREPFALIPLAWLSGLAGATLVAIAVKRGR
ncbi:MAG: DUF3955 domain-containing protein [Opitutales bacterium]